MRIIVLYFLLIIVTAGSSEWKLKKEESGISIYTRKVEGAGMDEFKGIVTIGNTTLARVLDVILDVANYPSLFPDCTEARILKQDGRYYDIHYIRLKAPWPVKDRDAVYETVVTLLDEGKKARVILRPLIGYLNEKEGVVRMNTGGGYWEIEEDNMHNVKVIYEFRADPGGSIPSWLANYGTITNPFGTLINLRQRVSEKH
jgi:hypothetical protein